MGQAPLTGEKLIVTTTFAKGDRVIIDQSYEPEGGKVFATRKGTVDFVYPTDSIKVTFDKDGGYTTGTFAKKYVRALPAERDGFKVGDKVRVHGRGTSDRQWWGTEGVVYDLPMWTSSLSVKLTKATARGYIEGNVATLGTVNLEHITETVKPTLFKTGDKVIVDLDKPTSNWHKAEGTVVGDQLRENNTTRVKLTKVSPNGNYHEVGTIYRLVGLTKVEPFTYKDIQIGDTIRRTRTYKTGTTEVREGTVTTKGPDYFGDSTTILAYSTDATNGAVLELLERPEPKPEPKITDGTKAGDQIVVVRKVNTKVYTKQGHDDWDTLILVGNEKPNRGFRWTDDEVAEFATNKSSTATLVKK